MSKVKNIVFTIWAIALVILGAKSSDSPKVPQVLYVEGRYCVSSKVILGKVKVRSQSH